MPKRKTVDSDVKVPKHISITPEERENRCISLAYDLVEQRLLNGTATSQETTHFLKLGSAKEKLERSILESQKKLMDAKTDAIESEKRVDEMYEEAIKSMKVYQGITHGGPEDENIF